MANLIIKKDGDCILKQLSIQVPKRTSRKTLTIKDADFVCPKYNEYYFKYP